MSESKNLYIAVILSIVVIYASNLLFPKKEIEPITETKVVAEVKSAEVKEGTSTTVIEPIEVEEALKADRRIDIENSNVLGSIRVKGARLDNIILTKYKQTLEPDSDNVELLQPYQTEHPYYVDFGWTAIDKDIKLPNENTLWNVKGEKLTPTSPIIFTWKNGQGITFIRKISVDDNYMFTIEQSVENDSSKAITLYPYGLINRKAMPEDYSSSVVHNGAIAVLGDKLKEEKYKSIKDDKKMEFESLGGWAGLTDRYWFTSLIFDDTYKSKVKFSNPKEDIFQVDYLGSAIEIAPSSVTSNSVKLYAGAKEIKLIDSYAKKLNINKFDLSIDFGWYYFLTKPFFYILSYLYELIGNMGWAILSFALLLRLVMFPIASKSYESMSKMKKVQPKIKELQERYGEDKMKLQQETMVLYKKEKINPAAGCLPMLIQIPVFFSLYKVLNIAIEIRHAPFIGWVKDLSAPDPLTISVMTHLPIPSLLDIGLWPIVMGLTMWIQQKLNPAPTNKDQARMFAMMPIIFTFMMGHFASGLVIYWTLSNVFSIIQQRAIMRKYGVK
ncbi:MAG: membrane protein insertase YidC [Lactobacillus sp.]|jgi:YidC/Oxa1 family membrane protein insertase|nr:membrane protein insertase YidC [Lactobacillus sp.]